MKFLFLVLILAAVYFSFRGSIFNKPVPDVVELPEDVKESIKNVKAQKSMRVPILLYHYVEYVKDEKDTIRKSLNIEPHILDAQIKTLKEAGYQFLTIVDLVNALEDKIKVSSKNVILTFDDGYKDFYTDVFPIVKKNGVKAVIFIVPAFLDKPNNLSTLELKEIDKSGLIEIGAHTMNHIYLKGQSRERVQYEVSESKKYLEKLLGHRVVSFAYPYGAFDNQTINIVKNAGFKSAVSTVSGFFAQDINQLFLYRMRPGYKTGGELLNYLEETAK